MTSAGLTLDRSAAAQPAPLLSVRSLKVEFQVRGRPIRILDGVSFDLEAGETLGIVGESGSGKSVTCLAIMGLLESPRARILEGSIRLDGRELVGASEAELSRIRGRQIAMIFQEPMTSLNPAFAAGEQIAEVVRRHEGRSWAEARRAAVDMLDRVGIPDANRSYDRFPHEMSGGMRQRVMIASALVCRPRLLIADEPTTALDVTIQAQILDLLRDASRDFGLGLIFITHNAGVVADICDRVVVLYAGQAVEAASVFDLFATPRHPYTGGLLRSVPPLDRTLDILPSIPGSPPAAGEHPPWCRFEPRCPFAEEPCRAGPVELVRGPDERSVRCVRAAELDGRL